ncbi:MAG: stage 0 sporulation protein [Anaerolineales bacterium]|nr:stage 0 sporulation protein [Anaerolineales bacterium]
MTDFIVGVRFQKVGKIYHFSANRHRDLQVGDHVIVETSRGRQLGEVAQLVDDPRRPENGFWKSVLRKATPRDLVARQVWEKKETEVVVNCRAKASRLKLEGVKIVSAELTLDGDRLTILYSNEADNKLDLAPLRKEMQKLYQVKISMRKIGPRDAAKIIGGMGACGLEMRCCSMYLGEFCPISIKMAKAQNVSLAPSEITGMCGRLRCCMQYEYDTYVEARKNLPRPKKLVSTPLGEGRVIKINPLKETVLVNLGERGTKEFPNEEISPPDHS